jgi:asparagine synthetase B (glutamine-hydrolysing)
MCGIAGFLLANGERVDTARLTRTLHHGIDPRGGDATGAAWIDRSGALHHMTVTGRARDFRSSAPNAASNATLAVLHTRMATQGTEHDQLNNHPIRSGHFYGVHNGHIYNDTELFAELPIQRRGEVDSEAAVALIRYSSMKGEPVWTALERLEGRAALAWIDDRDPSTLHMARGSGSPLEIAMTAAGSVLFASTKDALSKGMEAVGMVADWTMTAEEGTYLRFYDDRLVEMQSFTPNPGTWSGRWSSSSRDEKWWDEYLEEQHRKSASYRERYSWANEPFVLGYKKGKAEAKRRKAGSRTFMADVSGELTPYDDETYAEVFEHPSVSARAVAAEVEDNWHWDDKDLYHASAKALGWAGPASE